MNPSVNRRRITRWRSIFAPFFSARAGQVCDSRFAAPARERRHGDGGAALARSAAFKYLIRDPKAKFGRVQATLQICIAATAGAAAGLAPLQKRRPRLGQGGGGKPMAARINHRPIKTRWTCRKRERVGNAPWWSDGAFLRRVRLVFFFLASANFHRPPHALHKRHTTSIRPPYDTL